MLTTLPATVDPVQAWTWPQLAPLFEDLAARTLTAENVEAWLEEWSRLNAWVSELGVRRRLAFDRNTLDQAAQARYFAYLDDLAPALQAAEQRLKQKLLDSGLTPSGMAVPLRNLRAEADLFREANLALATEEAKLTAQYDQRVGAQTVEWDGREIPVTQLKTVFQEPDRGRRERAWWLARERQLQDREVLDELWQALLALRTRLAANAGQPDYRSYVWQAYHRFDYTPADCLRFHDAIAAVCVPAATRVYERQSQRLGVTMLRPWDLTNGTWGRPTQPASLPPLRPYRDAAELLARTAAVLRRVDPALGAHFETMRAEDLLDLDNRAGKAPGGYCTYYAVARRPFIFMNAVGLPGDVLTLLHEAGHAFHAFEKARLRYHPQLDVPMEFNEVASMAMELLAAPYLAEAEGGFYSAAEAARARVEKLEEMLVFWPYMAVIDAFQHWVYTHPQEAADPRRCDAQWQTQWRRFLPAVDWSGLEAELVTGWHRQGHIFSVPFYYVEYGLAALGAAQVWRNALRDQAAAVAAYCHALTLGGTAPLPQLFAAAGARFAFDADTLGQAVALIETQIAQLEATA